MAHRTAGQSPSRVSPGRPGLVRRFVISCLVSGLSTEALAPLAGPEGAPAPAPERACSVLLAGLDASGTTVFRTVALALDRPGLVVAPLHTLERGGVRWERLTIGGEIAAGRGGVADVAAVVSLDPSSDLAYLDAPGLPACCEAAGHGGGSGSETCAETGADVPVARFEATAGAAVLVLREKSGYRPAVVGGRVERAVDLPDGRRLILARLLDAAGADPGLMLDEAGRLVGSVAPAPSGSDPALAAIVLAGSAPERVPLETAASAPRLLMAPRSSPSFSDTVAGIVAQALLLAASGRAEAALARLDEAMRGARESAPLLLERGALRYASGRLPAAVADFTRASEIDPTSYLARFNLGVALGVSGRYEEAAAAFRRARDLAPASPRARFELALALRAANHGDAARGEWESLASLDPILARELKLLLGF